MTKTNRLYPTNRLYKPLGQASFDEAKQTFFLHQISTYYDQTILMRWQLLKEAFCKVSPSTSVQITLSAFIEKRLNAASDNAFVLSSEICLDYVERFYFLYLNNDPVFHLNTHAKAQLIRLLNEAITNAQICETGRFLRFEELINEFRADQNWIENQLQKQRYLIIDQLHQAYNEDKHITNAMKVHTLGVMLDYAKQQNMGVMSCHELRDLHMTDEKKCAIKHYFEKHAPSYFEAYEKNACDYLSEYVLLKLNDLLKINKINISQWDTCSVYLPNGYLIKLMPNIFLSVDEMDEDTIYLYLHGPYGKQIFGVTKYGNPFSLTEALQIEPHPQENIGVNDLDDIKKLLEEGKHLSLDRFKSN